MTFKRTALFAAITLTVSILATSPATADDISPMLPESAPTVTVTSEFVTCASGAFSQSASYVAYSLLVDGVAVSTSTTDDSFPTWLIPNLAETVSTGATVERAEFTWNSAWAGKTLQCAVLAYANHATGLIYSDEVHAA